MDEREATEVETEEEEEEEEVKPEKWKKHYSSRHRILLVGEGDFSFSLCLARAFGSAQNLVATSLDSQGECTVLITRSKTFRFPSIAVVLSSMTGWIVCNVLSFGMVAHAEVIAKKYSNGIGNVRELEDRGCIVLFGVDAKAMSQHFFLKTQRFDRIVYNFPHVGFLYKEDSCLQIQLNKRLVKGFLANAKALVKKEGGEIHVSHKEGDPYDKWDLVKKAEKRGLVLGQAVPFSKDDYPGYANKRAHGKVPDASFPLGDCTTYKFMLKTSI
ncbi:Heavy metal-associated isoprenylated plant protein 41 isoform A [Senna tora]|uniref:Heavy metal-associated isoprenylated plant protein 41 isoform A n=1 Tax=Senna tora TaxID=362788 RepID=A0A834X8P6_9FABA|nr:Heavy metal-associated isoprenylated plant protein 41 isoform A [Senna tora]